MLEGSDVFLRNFIKIVLDIIWFNQNKVAYLQRNQKQTIL